MCNLNLFYFKFFLQFRNEFLNECTAIVIDLCAVMNVAYFEGNSRNLSVKFNFQSFFESFLQIGQKQYESDVLREAQLKAISFQNYGIVKKFYLSLSPSEPVIGVFFVPICSMCD